MSLIKTYKPIPEFKLMKLATDHTGKRMGKLTIRRPIRSTEQHLIWLAECECGTQVEIRASQIQHSTIDSCGRCQKLPRYNLQELPYTLTDDEETPEQMELNIEAGQAEIERQIDKVFDDAPPAESCLDPLPLTAWEVAGDCCEMLEDLDYADQIQAVQLIRVRLGFEL